MKTLTIILMTIFLGCSAKEIDPSVPLKENEMLRRDWVQRVECEYPQLANDFGLKVTFTRYTNVFKDGSIYKDLGIIRLRIIDKQTEKPIDTIGISSEYFFDNVFKDCSDVVSYSTGFNADKEIVDNQFGDLVIADLNFDGKEDIALINDSGGNGGTFYNFYLQGADQKFTIDRYLTDSMVYFPREVNRKDKTLITYVRSGMCWVYRHTYQLEKTRQWNESNLKRNVCEE